MASGEVVTSMRRDPDEQAASAGNFVGCYKELLTAGLRLAGMSKVILLVLRLVCGAGCALVGLSLIGDVTSACCYRNVKANREWWTSSPGFQKDAMAFSLLPALLPRILT